MESLGSRIRRRLWTLPLWWSLTVLLLCSLPVLTLVAGLVDLIRDRRFPLLRTLAFFTVYLLCETIGSVAALALTPVLWVGGEPVLRTHYALMRWWNGTLFAAARTCFSMPLEIADEACIARGGAVVLVRHTSTADTILPCALLLGRNGIRTRYVLKSELRTDPCLDLVGHRVPNAFVRRASGDPTREIDAVRALAADVGPSDAVVIYPEGTRFTPARREARLASLARSAAPVDFVRRATALAHVLPPHLGGPLAALEHGADAVFVAHTGFEGARSLGDLFRGGLVGRTIRVQLWRVPAAEIPAGFEARAAWLVSQWERMDAWVGARVDGTPPA